VVATEGLLGPDGGRPPPAVETRVRIALVGQSVVDRVTLPGRPPVERLGGAPIFAGQAAAAAGVAAVVLTRGATRALRRPLHELGLPIIEGEALRSCISEMDLHPDGSCSDSFAAFGVPFTPVDVAGWMAPGLARARSVVCGAQWRDDFLPDTLAALATGGRAVYLDGQGPLRLPELGPVRLAGPLDPALLRHVTLLKLAEEEAAVALGGIDPVAARALGIPVVVTLAHRGAVLLVDGTAIPIGVDPVLGLADTVGAGDAFLALLAAERTEGVPLPEAIRHACAGVAALLRRRLGILREAQIPEPIESAAATAAIRAQGRAARPRHG
jgi:pfkB family carbohydrate kinase